jgi:serine protease inhibitor
MNHAHAKYRLSRRFLGVAAVLAMALPATILPGLGAEEGAGTASAPPTATDAAKPAVDSSPVEAQSADPKPVDAKPVEAKPVEAQPVEAKPVDAKPAEAKPVDARSADRKPADPKSADPKPMLGAQLRLGSNLVGKLADKKPEQANVVVSPASLAMVFSLLDLGASDPMRFAIARTLGFGDVKEAAKRDLEAMRSSGASVARRASAGGPLALANMIVFDPASQPFQPALQRLQAAGAAVSVEDISKPETIARINGWVKDKTKGLIPTVIEDPPELAGLVAVNALYFKDRWKAPFDPASTRDEPFHMSGGKSMEVPMMHADGHFIFRQNEKLVAVELPYASEDYRLVIVTSKDTPLGVNEFADAAGWLGGQGFAMQEGEVAMPRFSASGSEDLLPTLDALGLEAARKAPGALKGFSAKSQAISRVVQKTELRINEEGTEAAAATAVLTTRSAVTAPTQYVKMIVDKPFMFALRDRRAGLVLLQGYVGQPTPVKEAKKE